MVDEQHDFAGLLLHQNLQLALLLVGITEPSGHRQCFTAEQGNVHIILLDGLGGGGADEGAGLGSQCTAGGNQLMAGMLEFG
ncbi:hypothetical protein D3C80_1685940 [compost metagenome]